jgi:hypothetical protein
LYVLETVVRCTLLVVRKVHKTRRLEIYKRRV